MKFSLARSMNSWRHSSDTQTVVVSIAKTDLENHILSLPNSELKEVWHLIVAGIGELYSFVLPHSNFIDRYGKRVSVIMPRFGQVYDYRGLDDGKKLKKIITGCRSGNRLGDAYWNKYQGRGWITWPLLAEQG